MIYLNSLDFIPIHSYNIGSGYESPFTIEVIVQGNNSVPLLSLVLIVILVFIIAVCVTLFFAIRYVVRRLKHTKKNNVNETK